MQRIRRVGVLSLGKMLGALYALLGLIIGAIFTCVSAFGAAAAFAGSGDNEALGLLFGVGAIIILPLFYGIIGFIGGLIVAFLYNFLAGFVGGIEIYTE